jgi:CRISPR system Cascade subunit CasD
MHWLMFELAGALASFGGVAPGGLRDTDSAPTRSALLGLLASACGITRAESSAQQTLAADLQFAMRVRANNGVLRDYHTAQAPAESALKKRPRQTRKDELSVPKDDLNTVLSDRFYLQDFSATIAITSNQAKLSMLADALRAPKLVLFLGRKSCPLGWPMAPELLQADRFIEALQQFDERHHERLDRMKQKRFYVSEGVLLCADEGIALPDSGTVRRISRWDEPIDTAKRLFRTRVQQRMEISV